MDISILDRLIPAGNVLDTLAAEHDRRGTYISLELSKKAAHDTILARLLDGQLIAWSASCSIDCDQPSFGHEGQIIPDIDFYSRREIGEVPLSFWCNYYNAGSDRRTWDAVTNDFRFDFIDEEFHCRTGGAYGVAFDRRGLPQLKWSAPFNAEEVNPLDALNERAASGIAGRGRKPANWWPDFAAELAIYIFEEGLPGGDGTEGQGAVIDAVLSRMAERGAREPSRASIQPIVNKVLLRARAARN